MNAEDEVCTSYAVGCRADWNYEGRPVRDSDLRRMWRCRETRGLDSWTLGEGWTTEDYGAWSEFEALGQGYGVNCAVDAVKSGTPHHYEYAESV